VTGPAPGVGHLRIVDVDFTEERLVRFRDRSTVAAIPAEVADIEPDWQADALLILDDRFDLPDPQLIGRLLAGPCHVWHAGLLLGQGDRPEAWNICHGRAMFSADADPAIESTSWRMSLRALLVRNAVLSEFGGFDPHFDTISGLALDAGLRWISHGALMRHVPSLVAGSANPHADPEPTQADGIRIVTRRLGRTWGAWAIARGLKRTSLPVQDLAKSIRAMREPVPVTPTRYGLPAPESDVEPDARVTVLIPTVGRNDYLRNLLAQVSEQTRPPDEVVVVDQNPQDKKLDLNALNLSIPLRVVHLSPPGQCSARNLGLRASTGSHILFLDDDDEIPADLIIQHLRVLSEPEVAASCGVVDDRESGPAPASELFRKASSVFPTNNTMIRRSVLLHTGLFDPTYDKGARADHDLGMRSYLAGNLHVHDPRPRLYHHHAPLGGLRTHGARVRTRGNSRSTVLKRHLRTPTDIYLGLRYHTPEQVNEDLVLSSFATLTGHGSLGRRSLRLLAQIVLLPDTWRKTKAARTEGKRLFLARPELPTLSNTEQ